MKKNFAIYWVALSALFAGLVSCSESGYDESVELSPYAMVRSFSLGNIKSAYPAFTATGEDTTVVKTMTMESFAFSIDQQTGKIYNPDSLPFSTNVTKVVTNLSVEGVPAIYVDSIGDYVSYSTTDSIDFTLPRKLRVYSPDGQNHKDYTITVNVHQLNPDKIVWSKYPAIEGVVPGHAVEFNGSMCVFGLKGENSVVAISPLEGEPAWAVKDISGISSSSMLSSVKAFNGMLYAIVDGVLYRSDDAVAWTEVLAGKNLLSIVVSSDTVGEILVANSSEFMCSYDGVSFETVGLVPSGFPLYGVSALSYPLSHNKNIIRYIAIGYETSAKDGRARVWSKLSTETAWVDYENPGNSFTCPSLNGLSVVRWDNFLYAMGGAGKVAGTEVEAFASFYISKDNGIVWKVPSDFYHRIPEELVGDDSLFAVTVDSNNFMWIINADTTWKVIINRLGFNK